MLRVLGHTVVGCVLVRVVDVPCVACVRVTGCVVNVCVLTVVSPCCYGHDVVVMQVSVVIPLTTNFHCIVVMHVVLITVAPIDFRVVVIAAWAYP